MDPLEVRGRRRWPTRVVLRAWVRRHRVVAMVDVRLSPHPALRVLMPLECLSPHGAAAT